MVGFQCAKNIIPEITSVLGSNWDQPSLESILLNVTHAMMSKRDFEKLTEYNLTIPSGVYEGKMWKRLDKTGQWFLMWFGPHEDPGKISINQREILL